MNPSAAGKETTKRIVRVVVSWGWLVGLLAAATPAAAQQMLVDTLLRHGVALPDTGFEGAFDEERAPAAALAPGALATPLALLAAGSPKEQIAAAYTFGILAGRSPQGVTGEELGLAARQLIQMIGASDRRARIAGARVAGRVFTVPFDRAADQAVRPIGLVEALFTLLNRPDEYDQLAAMDALGRVRAATAVQALTERFRFYRQAGRRALAGGALEALARIGDPSSVALVTPLGADRWAEGRDRTALAVAFARERLLRDGSRAAIQQALTDRARRLQARSYLIELGLLAP
jgi:hypothetical protein